METGDLATWVAAGTSLIALATAAVATAYTRKMVRIERERDERRDTESKRQFAEQVGAWTVRADAASSPATPRVLCVLRNGSSLPIFDVQLEYEAEEWGDDDFRELLPPGEHMLELPDGAEKGGGEFRVQVEFTDAQGLRWRRGYDGRLSVRTAW